jgi:Ras family protein A
MEVSRKIRAKHYVECSAKTGEGVHLVFLHATREALRPRPEPSHKPSKVLKSFKELLKAPLKDGERDVKSESAPQLDDVEEQELKKLLLAATSAAPQPLRKFRLLIIGKTGCGKTTILSKVNTRVTSRAPGK